MDETPKIARPCIQPALKNLYVGAMLILAIDTALDACAAAVLDTSASNVIAQESQPMKRGHAEALLPVVRTAYVEPNPAVFKGVLHEQGKIATPDVRLPLLNASDASVANCLAEVARASR